MERTMKKIFFAFLLVLVLLSAGDALLWTHRAIGNLTKRVEVLEQRCTGQCKYGDVKCGERCRKAGHCPMQDM